MRVMKSVRFEAPSMVTERFVTVVLTNTNALTGLVFFHLIWLSDKDMVVGQHHLYSLSRESCLILCIGTYSNGHMHFYRHNNERQW